MGPCMSSPNKGEPLLLPQAASVDAQRERASAIDKARNTYAYAYEPFPAHVSKVPLVEIPGEGVATLTKVGIHLEVTAVQDWLNYLAKHRKIYEEQAKAEEGKPNADAFALYNLIFPKNRLPEIAKDNKWKTDEAFGIAHTDGLFPWYITKADLGELRKKMNITDDRVDKTTNGQKLEDLGKAGRLYVSDHDVLTDIPKKKGAEDVVLIPTMTLFWVDDNKKLMPLAIQLGQTTSSPIITPQDGKPNAWLGAKTHVGFSNLMVHSGYYHAFEMHFFMETFWTSCCRNLADLHPLKQLIKPHAYNTLFANFGVRGTLKEGGSLDKLFGCGAAGAVVIAENCWKKFGYTRNLDIEENLKRRDVAGIPEFKYRDDALKYWAVHKTYMSDMVKIFYKDDADVAADYELQNWVKDMADPKTCATKGLPVDPATGELKTRDQLISFLLCSFFNAVFQHTYVENIGLLYWGYAPMNPASFRLPIEMLTRDTDITETDIANALPDKESAISQNALSWSVNEVDPKEVLLLGYFPKDFLAGAPPATQDVIKKWREQLQVLSDEVQKRDKLTNKPIVWISIIH